MSLMVIDRRSLLLGTLAFIGTSSAGKAFASTADSDIAYVATARRGIVSDFRFQFDWDSAESVSASQAPAKAVRRGPFRRGSSGWARIDSEVTSGCR